MRRRRFPLTLLLLLGCRAAFPSLQLPTPTCVLALTDAGTHTLAAAVTAALPATQRHTLPPFLRDLEALAPWQRTPALESLLRLFAPNPTPELRPFFEQWLAPSTPSPWVVVALEALASLGDGEARSAIEATLAHPEPEARIAAIQALVRIDPGDGRRLNAIVRCLGDASLAVRREAVDAFVLLDASPVVAEALRPLTVDGEPELRAHAVDALHRLNGWNSDDVPDLLARAGNASDPTRTAAVRALSRFPQRSVAEPLQRIALEASRAGDEARDVLAHVFHEARYHRLYRKVEDPAAFFGGAPGPFQRFEKTHSDLLLLAGVHAGKTVLRGVPAASAAHWRRLAGARDLWRRAGFAEVPIEPCVAVDGDERDRDAEAAVRRAGYEPVYTRVLPGPSLRDYADSLAMRGRHSPGARAILARLAAEKERILRVVHEEFGVRHSAEHDGNFVVVFRGTTARLFFIDLDRLVPLASASP